MRCRACDSVKDVRKSLGDYYCSKCRSSIMDTIQEDRMLDELDSFNYEPYGTVSIKKEEEEEDEGKEEG